MNSNDRDELPLDASLWRAVASLPPNYEQPLSLKHWPGTVMIARFDKDLSNRSVAHVSRDYRPPVEGRPQHGARLEIVETMLVPSSRIETDTQVTAFIDFDQDIEGQSTEVLTVDLVFDGESHSAVGVRTSPLHWTVSVASSSSLVSVIASGTPVPGNPLELSRSRNLDGLIAAREGEFQKWRSELV